MKAKTMMHEIPTVLYVQDRHLVIKIYPIHQSLNDDNINKQALSGRDFPEVRKSFKISKQIVIGSRDLASFVGGAQRKICFENRPDMRDGGRYKAASTGD